MTKDTFQQQVKELQLNWPNKFNPPFLSRLWMALQHATDESLVDAVHALIFAGGPPPSGEKILAAVEKAKVQQSQAQRGSGGGYGDLLAEAQRNNKLADPEFVEQCMKLINGYTAKYPTISKDQFLQGCGYLEDVEKINSRAAKGKQHGN
jgi:hypothetical protein